MVIIWIVVIGLMIGSFLNVCIARIPAGESIISPGSRCPSCRAPIAWYDNIPVISYLVLGGRCRACQARISARYPIVELVTAVAFVLVGLIFWPNVWMVAQRLVFTALLIALFGTDLDVQRLPDVLTLPGLVAGLLFSLVTGPGRVDPDTLTLSPPLSAPPGRDERRGSPARWTGPRSAGGHREAPSPGPARS